MPSFLGNTSNTPALALTACLFAVSCGGGGGSAPTLTTSELIGQLQLEREPETSSSLREPGVPTATHFDDEPNDRLYSAIDLGDGSQHAEVVGSLFVPGDRDVYRVGPVPQSLRMAIRFESRSARLTILQAAAGVAPTEASTCASGEVALDVPRGSELTLIASGSEQDAYRLTVAANDGATTDVRVERADAMSEWHRVIDVTGDCVPGEILCSSPSLDASAAATLGMQLVDAGGGVARLRCPRVAALPAGRGADLAIANLVRDVRRSCRDARFVSPNLRAPLTALAGRPVTAANDPLFPSQFNLALTRFPQAWQTTKGDDSVTVAVMDTGVLAKHPDLAARISPHGFDFISDPENAGDGDGVDADPSEPDEYGTLTWFHGTYVAGVLGAVSNNERGIAGATWNGKILPIRVFGKLGGTTFDRVQAMRYMAGLPNSSGRLLAAEHRPRVVNMSFVLLATTAAERAAVADLAAAGIHMVAAVGNDAFDPAPPIYPAAWPEVIGVASVARELVRAPYSNVASFVDVSACGGTEIAGPAGVTSTWAFRIGNKLEYLYNSFMGTSVATPSVSAAIALCEAVHPHIEPGLVRRILQETSCDLGKPGRDDEYGWGLLQADAAVQRALATETPPFAKVAPSLAQFSNDVDEVVVRVENAGGGSLDGLQIHPVGEPTGALSWSLDGRRAPARLRVRLDRDKLVVGTYRESFRLDSNAASVMFDVAFRKPIPKPPASIDVRLHGTRGLVARVGTDGSGRFRFPGLAAGRYTLEAGIDRDGNGRLGDPQEWYYTATVEVRSDRENTLDGVVVPWRH